MTLERSYRDAARSADRNLPQMLILIQEITHERRNEKRSLFAQDGNVKDVALAIHE